MQHLDIAPIHNKANDDEIAGEDSYIEAPLSQHFHTSSIHELNAPQPESHIGDEKEHLIKLEQDFQLQ